MNMDDTISKINSLKTIPDELFKRTSESARWAIPLERIHDPKKVWLTVEEAMRIKNALWELLRNSNDKNAKEWLTYWMVNGRIEQAEKQK